jgi:hypothetical protein
MFLSKVDDERTKVVFIENCNVYIDCILPDYEAQNIFQLLLQIMMVSKLKVAQKYWLSKIYLMQE